MASNHVSFLSKLRSRTLGSQFRFQLTHWSHISSPHQCHSGLPRNAHCHHTIIFLLITSILQPDSPLMPSQIDALVAYSQDSHLTIGSMLKAIKMPQCQVATMQKALKEDSHTVKNTCKMPTKSPPLPSSVPSSATTSAKKPLPWKGKTLPDDPSKTWTLAGKTWFYCTKCLVTGSWVSTHQTSLYTPKLGTIELIHLQYINSCHYCCLVLDHPEVDLDFKSKNPKISKKPKAQIAAIEPENLDTTG